MPTEPDARRLGRFAVAELSAKLEDAVRRIHLHGPHEVPGGLTTDERALLHARLQTLLDHEAAQADVIDALAEAAALATTTMVEYGRQIQGLQAENQRLTAALTAAEAERDRLRQERDQFRSLAQRYQMEHNREWDQGACQCPRCQPFHDLFSASIHADRIGPLPLPAEPAP